MKRELEAEAAALGEKDKAVTAQVCSNCTSKLVADVCDVMHAAIKMSLIH